MYPQPKPDIPQTTTSTLNPEPTPETQNRFGGGTSHHDDAPVTPHPEPHTPNPKPHTPYPKPQTPEPKALPRTPLCCPRPHNSLTPLPPPQEFLQGLGGWWESVGSHSPIAVMPPTLSHCLPEPRTPYLCRSQSALALQSPFRTGSSALNLLNVRSSFNIVDLSLQGVEELGTLVAKMRYVRPCPTTPYPTPLNLLTLHPEI